MNTKFNSKSMVLVALIALAAVPTFAATSGTLFLSGVVAPVTSITVQADPNASNLPVGTTVSNLVVASVNELSNNKAGYTVSLSTANGGMLKETNGLNVGLADTVPYTLSYNGSAVSFSSGSAVISRVSSRTTGSGTTNSLAISFASAFLNADTYTDTLTFTIAAN
jgi:hypothetical protein